MATNPARISGLDPRKGTLFIGSDADLLIMDLQREWTVDPDKLYTKNQWSPFGGWRLKGKVERTIVRGKTVYDEGAFPQGPGYGTYLRADCLALGG